MSYWANMVLTTMNFLITARKDQGITRCTGKATKTTLPLEWEHHPISITREKQDQKH